jgi:hypothetical protein
LVPRRSTRPECACRWPVGVVSGSSPVSQRRVSSTFFYSRLKKDSAATLWQAPPTRPTEPTTSLLSSSRLEMIYTTADAA